jgi:hypothetical protein
MMFLGPRWAASVRGCPLEPVLAVVAIDTQFVPQVSTFRDSKCVEGCVQKPLRWLYFVLESLPTSFCIIIVTLSVFSAPCTTSYKS